MHRLNRTVIFISVVFILATASTAQIADPVKVEQGLLSGATGKQPDVRVYRGIPFAAPPVGELRWKGPQPPAAWKGVREAKEFSHACWQTPYPATAVLYRSELPPLSEDCLYLNIWTAAKSPKAKLPVMVWIHGGGFTRGHADSRAYDGESLARKGVIVVTINYRLGIFGFFAHPELTAESKHHASGNYALLDQLAALQWVKKNIAAFGGDPGRVTIFGESAGSWAVNALMASPLAKGLFHRAIGESGGIFSSMPTLAESEKAGVRLTTELGIEQHELKVLRERSAEELLKATDGEIMLAIVDGWVVPQDVHTIFARGKQNDVPLIVGNNADEGTALAPQMINTKAAFFAAGVQQRYGERAPEFLKIYPAGSDEEAVHSFYAAYRDQVFGWEMRTWAAMQSHTGHQPAYLYYFSRRPPGPQSSRFGAFHGAEIAYVFGSFVWPFPWEDADKKLSETIEQYWVNFATTGNPNGEGLVRWPAYDPAKDQALELGDEVKVRAQVNKAGLDFFDKINQPRSAAGSN